MCAVWAAAHLTQRSLVHLLYGPPLMHNVNNDDGFFFPTDVAVPSCSQAHIAICDTDHNLRLSTLMSDLIYQG